MSARLKVEIIEEREKARKVRYMGQEQWIPESQIERVIVENGVTEIVIPDWLCEKTFG